MAYINKIFDENFLQYASYVIRDRAIPHLKDGLKPVQRRILQSLYDMDDSKLHKVANVVGYCMSYHPHGDASIYSALVSLANKELLIERQGNFGNIFTGSPASAARYIECRLQKFARETLFNKAITEFVDSYDGRKKEPVALPAKLPFVLILGAEGIAVGMSTKILPHNLVEILQAMKAALLEEDFELFPDFPTGGLIDASNYEDGHGKILSRARLDTSQNKKVLITGLPYGITTDSLIASIEAASKKGKLKISAISDYTAENVEVEISLPKGIKTESIVDSLYAYTDCEVSISTNLLVLDQNRPRKMTVSEVIHYQAASLKEILKLELEYEYNELLDKIFIRSLEHIFIVENIYKQIEKLKSNKEIIKTVAAALEPFAKELKRSIGPDDIEHLLKIPIRRISLYDIKRMKKEIREIKSRLKEINTHLAELRDYAISWLQNYLDKSELFPARQTQLTSFNRTAVREIASRDKQLFYDKASGFLGHELKGASQELFKVSTYDRILLIKADASYSIIDVPKKLFIGKGMLYCGFAYPENLENLIFTLIYKNKLTGYPYIKRCKIIKFILNKEYNLIPEETSILKLISLDKQEFRLSFKSLNRKPSSKKANELSLDFNIEAYPVKGVKARGTRLKDRAVKKLSLQ